MKKVFILLFICFVTSIKLYAGWSVDGIYNVIPYKPYQYRFNPDTGIHQIPSQWNLYTITVTGGQIMDANGNFTLTSIQATDIEISNMIMTIIWEPTNNASLVISQDHSSFGDLHPNIGSAFLNINNATLSGNELYECAIVNLQNTIVPSGSNIEINGFKEVRILPSSKASLGCKLRISSYIPAPAFPPRGIIENTTDNILVSADQDYLSMEQNNPNPFKSGTKIGYFIPAKSHSAYIQIANIMGQVISKIQITEKGRNSILINGSELLPGIYNYSLVVDGRLIDTKRMIVSD